MRPRCPLQMDGQHRTHSLRFPSFRDGGQVYSGREREGEGLAARPPVQSSLAGEAIPPPAFAVSESGVCHRALFETTAFVIHAACQAEVLIGRAARLTRPASPSAGSSPGRGLFRVKLETSRPPVGGRILGPAARHRVARLWRSEADRRRPLGKNGPTGAVDHLAYLQDIVKNASIPRAA